MTLNNFCQDYNIVFMEFKFRISQQILYKLILKLISLFLSENIWAVSLIIYHTNSLTVGFNSMTPVLIRWARGLIQCIAQACYFMLLTDERKYSMHLDYNMIKMIGNFDQGN